MPHKPKPIRDHYSESFSVNSAGLKKLLASNSIPDKEIAEIINSISKPYFAKVDTIVIESDKDMMALEFVPSPLTLFVSCIAEVKKSLLLSSTSYVILEKYGEAWEDWM